MKKGLQIVLHLLGFPLLIALVVVFSINMISLGISYGVMVFVGLIITLLMAGIYYLVFFLMAKRGKKTIYKQTFISIIVAAVCLGGLWLTIDVSLPELLSDATSNTIFYEDLADDYDARAQVNKDLLNEYIRRNVENGNLKALSKEQYLEQGASNKEVVELIKKHTESIHYDGYDTFVGPWLDMANDSRMTIPVLVHLIVNEREFAEKPFPTRQGDEMVDASVRWSILDMLGEPMEFDLGEDGMGVISNSMAGGIDLFEYTVNVVLDALSNGIADEDVVGSPIYIRLKDGKVLQITPSNESRGVLDYQRMKWLESNGLIYMITSLFSIRKLFLIFAGVLIVTTYAIGLLRESQEKDKTSNNGLSQKDKTKKVKEKNKRNDSVATEGTMDIYKPYDPDYEVVKRYDLLEDTKIARRYETIS